MSVTSVTTLKISFRRFRLAIDFESSRYRHEKRYLHAETCKNVNELVLNRLVSDQVVSDRRVSAEGERNRIV